jgi:hypothetical protein
MMNRITCRFGSYCTSQNEKGKGIPTHVVIKETDEEQETENK